MRDLSITIAKVQSEAAEALHASTSELEFLRVIANKAAFLVAHVLLPDQVPETLPITIEDTARDLAPYVIAGGFLPAIAGS